MGLFTLFIVSVGSCSCLFPFCVWMSLTAYWPFLVNRLSHLPQRGSSVVPFTPGQCRLDPSSHILFFRVHSAQVLWHWYAELHSSCSVAVMSQGVFLSFFLSPFPLAQVSTKANFYTVLFAYEDGSLIDVPLEKSPLKFRLHSGWVSSGLPALFRLSPDFCSFSMPVTLGPSPLIRGVKCCPFPGTGEGVVVSVSYPRTYMIWGLPYSD